jgi:5-methyltetrahydrofolate--homocysteine methyltransferase
MFGHDNFSEVQKSWTGFWQGKHKGPLYAITVPRDGKTIKPRPSYLSWFNGDFEKTADILERWYDSCEFYGAAVPLFSVSFGADDLAAFLGADLIYQPSEDPEGATSWTVRCLDDLKNTDIRFAKNGKWWNKTIEFHDVLKKRLDQSVMISAPNICGGLDALAALHGAEPLLMDLLDESENVHRALDQINTAFTEIITSCEELFEHKKYGSITRHGMYSAGTTNIPQCDFSCMISPALFEEFVVPGLTHEFSFMNGGEYHFDGPDAIRHLEGLVKIPGLDVIQWVPGAGAASKKDWTELYRRILSYGKGLILGSSPEHAEELLRRLPSNKLFIQIHGIKSRTEAEDFLAKMDKVWEGLSSQEK